MQAKVYDFAAERDHRQTDMAAALATYDRLPCLTCGNLTSPHAVSAGHVVSYRCSGQGHRARDWRIDEDGDILLGARGNRRMP